MKRVNIVIPAFSESSRLPKTLDSYLECFSTRKEFSLNHASDAKFLLKLIIVSDGSTDDTAALANQFLKESNVEGEVIAYKENRGKGYAVRKGLLSHDTADYYYLADADMSANWDVLVSFLEVVDDQKADAVIASRAVDDSQVQTLWYKKLFGRGASFMINTLLNLDIKDTQCGYKLFSKSCYSVFRQYQINDWGFDFELLYLLKQGGKKIVEKGITWRHVPASNVSFGAYFQTIVDLVRVKFGRW